MQNIERVELVNQSSIFFPSKRKDFYGKKKVKSSQEEMDPQCICPTFLLCALENGGPQDPGGIAHLQVCGLPTPLEGPGLHPGHPPRWTPCDQGETEAQGPPASTSLLVVKVLLAPQIHVIGGQSACQGGSHLVCWSHQGSQGEGRAYRGDPCSPGRHGKAPCPHHARGHCSAHDASLTSGPCDGLEGPVSHLQKTKLILPCLPAILATQVWFLA